MRKLILSYLLFFACIPFPAFMQGINRYNVFRYSVNEGLLQTTMADVAIDKNNFCWLSFPNGIQKFDGKNFINVPIQPGLPEDKTVAFFQKRNEDLLIAHSHGISLYDIARNSFREVYQFKSDLRKGNGFLGEDEDIVYFIDGTDVIGLHSTSFEVKKMFRNIIPFRPGIIDTRISVSRNSIAHRVAFVYNKTAYLFDFAAGRIIANSENNRQDFATYFIRMVSPTKIYCFSYERSSRIAEYDFMKGERKPHLIAPADKLPLGRFDFLYWQNKPLFLSDNRLYETDSLITVAGAEIVNYQNEPVAGNSSLWRAIEDKVGNLYLLSVTSGIVKVIRNNYSLRYYGTGIKEENNVLSVLPDKKNNRVLIGCTGTGLMIFDTSQVLIKQLRDFKTGREKPSVNGIIPDGTGGYFISCVGETRLWHIDKELTIRSQLPLRSVSTDNDSNPYIDYFAHTLYRDNETAILQTQGRLVVIDLQSKKAIHHLFTKVYSMAGLIANNRYITHAGDDLFFADPVTFSVRRTVRFLHTGGVRCIIAGTDNNYILGTNNGIFKIDTNGRLLSHWTKSNGLPDNCIYAMAIDGNEDLWCSTNKGLFKLRDGRIFQLKKEDGLQENEFNTNVVARSEDGEIFFGGVNGVTAFYPEQIAIQPEKVKVIVTDIKANNKSIAVDTAAWNIDRIVLPYTQSSLSFDFITIANNNPDQYVYQYQMVGVDKEWIRNDGMQTVRYALPPGKYIFRIYASRFFDKDAQAMKEIVIIIRPPFWKTWWFLSLLGLVFISLLVVAINGRVKRKYRKKLRQLESEQKIKLERERISRDLHDTLGAYANAVLFNTELLEQEPDDHKKKELMKDVKFASKDIITSLRETVWALKQEHYTAQDCLLRIRNFIQPFGRYYSHIDFIVEGDAPAMLQLHYTRALNLVRIVQEAVSNSIKHALAKKIIVRSFFTSNEWTIEVEDDGKGFDPAYQQSLASGNGLANMRQRASDGGFTFDIYSSNKSGTLIRIMVNYN